MKIEVKAVDESLQAVNEFVHSGLPENCPKMILNQIDLAVEEIFVNIAHYAYEETGVAAIDCEYADSVLKISFSDSGRPFNPLLRPDPDLTLSAQERKIGGLGIYLTKKFMDDVFYAYENGQNILTFTKKIF